MSKSFGKLLLAALIASLALSLGPSGAAALRSLRLGVARLEYLTGALVITEGATRIICEVGLTITPNRNPIAKSPTNPIARASMRVLGQEAGNERCSEEVARVLSEHEPFTVNYLSFDGILPNITGLHFELLAVTIETRVFVNVCLITANIIGTVRVNSGFTIEFSGPESARFRLERVSVSRTGGVECPRPNEVAIEGNFRPTAGIALSLI